MEDVKKHKYCDGDNKHKPDDSGSGCAKKSGVDAGEQGDAKIKTLDNSGEVDAKKSDFELDTEKQRELGDKKREHRDSDDFYPISM